MRRPEPTATMQLRKGEAYVLQLPAALADDPPPDWAFWPSGIVRAGGQSPTKGEDGAWTANFSALTARAEIATYATN